MGMAVRVPGGRPVPGSAIGNRAAASSAGAVDSAVVPESCPAGWSRQGGDLPYLEALLRHPPPHQRIRHPDGAGTARPPERKDDHDLHPCAEPRRPGSAESSRPAVRDKLRRLIQGTPSPEAFLEGCRKSFLSQGQAGRRYAALSAHDQSSKLPLPLSRTAISAGTNACSGRKSLSGRRIPGW